MDGHAYAARNCSSVWVSRPLIEGVTILYSFAAVHHNPLMLVYICMWQGGH